MGPLLFQTLYCIAGIFAAITCIVAAALIVVRILINKEKND